MNIFNKISENEQDIIADYIEAYAGFDGEGASMKAPLSHILRFWNSNKIDLFNVFGGELILSKKVSFAKPIPMIEDDMVILTNGVGQPFYRSFERWRNKEISTIGENYKYRWELGELVYASNLANNIWTGDNFSIITPDGHKIDVNKGCKISKVLGKIARAFNLEGYEDFRIAHSQYLNQKKLNGELCISIHPLDYMTMSDNACDWSSCMSWEDMGDYRQGTVEMMNSPCIVVAYLKSSDDMHTPGGHTWNSKKWRCLFIVTPHIITGIREYPYENPEVSGTVLQWLRELVTLNTTWGPFEETVTKVRNHSDITVASMDRVLYLDFHTHMMYNDFYADRPAYLAPTIPDRYDLCFSGESECMVCGQEITYFGGDHQTNALIGECCDDSVYCGECGERIPRHESYYVDGYHVCEYCYDNHCVECHCCEEVHHESDVYPIYLCVNNELTSYHIMVCSACEDSDQFANIYGVVRRVPYGRWDERRVVDIENFANIDALDSFDIWNNEDYENFKTHLGFRASDEN